MVFDISPNELGVFTMILMDKFGRLSVLLASMVGAGLVYAADSSNQNITTSVNAINEIAVSAPAASLIISSVDSVGGALASVQTTATYDFTTNDDDNSDGAGATTKKITAELSGDAIPTGVTLTIDMTAPGTGTSTGGVNFVNTTSGPQDLVNGITPVSNTGVAIAYTLAAEVTAGVVSVTPTVTYTITDE